MGPRVLAEYGKNCSEKHTARVAFTLTGKKKESVCLKRLFWMGCIACDCEVVSTEETEGSTVFYWLP